MQFQFPTPHIDPSVDSLRLEVRALLERERVAGSFVPTADCWVAGLSEEFSHRLGQAGLIGVTWPTEYGGRGLTAFHRYAITEELLVAGAPVHLHWIADRQSGPLILRCGSEEMKHDILPRIAAGECFFAIGMSEPGSGSDLASVRTRAERVDGGWRLNGTKLWSSGARQCHYMIVLARTDELDTQHRHAGLSQFLVDLRLPNITIRGITDMSGHEDFNETHFDNVLLSDAALLGTAGDGWAQVTGELALERSGPERFLTTFILLEEFFKTLGGEISRRQAQVLGRLLGRISALRHMALGVAALLDEGRSPETEAALVKDLGTRFEGDIIETLRELMPISPRKVAPSELERLLADSLLRMPSFTLRGGASEVLQGLIARGLGLR